MLASIFIAGGADTLRNPAPRVAIADPVAPKLAEPLPLPSDTEQLVKINAAAQVAAGTLLALGWFPRLSAAVLVGSLVPTTAVGHRFWEEEDPAKKAQQRVHFLKNTAILGGLIIAALDTEGRPSVGWRARRAAERAAKSARELLPVS